MNLQAVSIGENAPTEVNVVIEVPIGGEPIKYEMDKASGALKVDRFLYTSMRYPGNYGFIPHTLSDDGDPCDVIVANTRAIIPGAIMSCRIVGVLLMEDEAGGDEKLLAVPSAKLTQRYARVNTFTDLPEITLKQIEHQWRASRYHAPSDDLEQPGILKDEAVKLDAYVAAIAARVANAQARPAWLPTSVFAHPESR